MDTQRRRGGRIDRGAGVRGSITQGTEDSDYTFLVQFPNGTVVATYRNHDKDSSGVCTYCRTTAPVSHDGGAAWACLSGVVERAANAFSSLWEPSLESQKVAHLKVCCDANAKGTGPQVASLTISKNPPTITHWRILRMIRISTCARVLIGGATRARSVGLQMAQLADVTACLAPPSHPQL